MSGSTKTISHPSLGKIKGSVDVAGVTTFKNLQYATLPYGRFTQSVLRDSLASDGEEWDATKFGYIPLWHELRCLDPLPLNL
jgi:hypothetical protein